MKGRLCRIGVISAVYISPPRPPRLLILNERAQGYRRSNKGIVAFIHHQCRESSSRIHPYWPPIIKNRPRHHFVNVNGENSWSIKSIARQAPTKRNNTSLGLPPSAQGRTKRFILKCCDEFSPQRTSKNLTRFMKELVFVLDQAPLIDLACRHHLH